MFIAGHIFSSIFWGIVIALAVTALAVFIVKAIAPNRSMTPLSWIAALIMTVMVCIQSTLMVGAIKAKSIVADMEEAVNAVAEKTDEFSTEASSALNIQEKINNVKEKYPYIKQLADTDKLSTANAKDTAANIHDAAQHYLNWYIVRRIGWGLLFTVIGTLIMYKTMDSTRQYGLRLRQGSTNRYVYDD